MYMPQSITDLPLKISEVFRGIENDIPLGVQGLFERRLDVESYLPIYLGIESPNKYLLLSVVIPKIFFNVISLEETQGFTLAVSADKGMASTFKLSIQISDKRFYELFLVLIQDLIETILKQLDTKSSIEKFAERLEYWKTFLKKSTKRLLSFEEQLGLVGELSFLKYLIELRGVPFALDSWKGPLGASQDFNCASNLIEVKSSAINRENEIKISSEYQLDAPLDSSLYLYHCIFNVNDEKFEGKTLPLLVSEIANEIPEVYKVRFTGLLKSVGYFQEDEASYKSKVFDLIKTNFYYVDEEFPKLVSSLLPRSIFGVTYRISTDELGTHLVDMNDVIIGIS